MNKKFKIKDLPIFPSTTGVYTISFDGGKKVYIGSASANSSKIKSGNGFYNRWKKHIHMLRNNKHHSPALQNAFNKHGESKISFQVLEECEPNNCIAREQYYIDYFDSFKNGYNGRPVADSNFGYKPTESHKLKLKANYKKFRDNIAPQVIALYEQNKTTREISKKLNISRSFISKIFMENNVNSKNVASYTKKSIYQYSLDGCFIKKWDSIRGCADALGIKPVSIRFVLNGKCKQSNGFYFNQDKLNKNEVIKRINKIGNWNPKTKEYINIKQIDSNGGYIKTWKNVREIMNSFGCKNNGPITRAIKENKKYKGFLWILE